MQVEYRSLSYRFAEIPKFSFLPTCEEFSPNTHLVLKHEMTTVFAVSHFIGFHPLVIVVSALGRHHGNFGRFTKIHF